MEAAGLSAAPGARQSSPGRKAKAAPTDPRGSGRRRLVFGQAQLPISMRTKSKTSTPLAAANAATVFFESCTEGCSSSTRSL